MSNQDDASLPPLQDDGTNQVQSTDDDQRATVPVDPFTEPHATSSVPIDVPEEAADVDLIEKEWVVKAKQIVEQTNENPYRKQEEIAKMKVEYIKKRYKRDVDL